MRPGREEDVAVARDVFNYVVKVSKKILVEEAPLGERPLRKYTTDMLYAWEVAEKLGVTVIPIVDGLWFAFVGKEERWTSPSDFIQYLQKGEFMTAGAAVEKSAALAICRAALKSVEHRKKQQEGTPDLQIVPPEAEDQAQVH